MTFDKDFLATVTEETLYPLQKVIADAVMIQLNGEAFVGNLVEGFTEVKEHCIYLVAVIQAGGDVLCGTHQLAFTGFSESRVGCQSVCRAPLDAS